MKNTVSGVLSSELHPGSDRIFYNYPRSAESIPFLGYRSFPSRWVARVVKDASGNNKTQATNYSYNNQANVISTIDPLGRATEIDRDSNGMNVLAVKRFTGGTSSVTVSSATFTGTPPHRPATVTDGAGQTTTFTYSPTTGQVLTITNPKSEVTTLTYETNTSSAGYGRLLSITGAVPGGDRTFTYDSYGRVQTTTDSEGYTLTYDYDALDRLRTITYPDASTGQLEYTDQKPRCDEGSSRPVDAARVQPAAPAGDDRGSAAANNPVRVVPLHPASAVRGREQEHHGMAAQPGRPGHEEDPPRRDLRVLHLRSLRPPLDRR